MDPHKSAYLFEATIEHDLYEGLVIYAPGGGLAGGAAKSWDISPDGTIYTFHLRPGLRWSNGEPLTAEDFVYSFRRLVDPATKSPSATLATPVKNAEEISTGKNAKVEQLGIEAVGSDVVRITLRTPTPYFISALTNSCFAPVNRKAVLQSGGTLGQPQTSITNGAYLLDTWSPGSRLVLKKNPYYWDAAHVQIAEVHYLPMPEASKEFQLYLDGQLDITWDVPADQIAKLRASRSNEFKLFPFFGDYYYGFDMKALPFKDNPKLRQALAMAIDREAITSEITGGGELPAYSWVPPGLPGYEIQTVEWKSLPTEMQARAKQLYSEAGYGPDKPLKVQVHMGDSEVRRKVFAAAAKQWKDVLGVMASPTTEEFILGSQADPAVGHMTALGWNADYADANAFLEIWKSDSSDNSTGYSNHAYDLLINEAALQKNSAERSRKLAQAERLLLNDMPIIPLYDSVLKKMVRPNVIGYSPNVLGYAYSKDISFAPSPTAR